VSKRGEDIRAAGGHGKLERSVSRRDESMSPDKKFEKKSSAESPPAASSPVAAASVYGSPSALSSGAPAAASSPSSAVSPEKFQDTRSKAMTKNITGLLRHVEPKQKEEDKPKPKEEDKPKPKEDPKKPKDKE
jgi:hypothetical protein